MKTEAKIEVKTEVKAETEGLVKPQEGERKKKARRGTRSAAALAIRRETSRQYFPGAAFFRFILNDDDVGADDGPDAGAGESSVASRSQGRTIRAAGSTDTTGAGADAIPAATKGPDEKAETGAAMSQATVIRWRRRKMERVARVFRSWSGRFYDGELGVVYEHVESKRDQPAGISDLDLSLVSGREDKLRAMAPELYHVLVMLTRGRAQKLVSKAGEPEGFEAYRLLLRRYEPQTTATTVTKLVELLSTQFAGDIFGLRD